MSHTKLPYKLKEMYARLNCQSVYLVPCGVMVKYNISSQSHKNELLAASVDTQQKGEECMSPDLAYVGFGSGS